MKNTIGTVRWTLSLAAAIVGCGGDGNQDPGSASGAASGTSTEAGSAIGIGSNIGTGTHGSTGTGSLVATTPTPTPTPTADAQPAQAMATPDASRSSGTGHGTAVTQVMTVAETTACAQHAVDASLQQLDLLVVQDKTGSMEDQTAAGASKWKVISEALEAFLQDSKSAGIGAGIEFFGGSNASSCVVANYEKPSVPIANLPGNAAAISAAIRSTNPNGRTPTPAALAGALAYARAWQSAHLTHKTVVVLATDGLPNRYPNAAGTGCSGTGDDFDPDALAKTLEVAGAGLKGTPSIPTYVIGVMAPSDTSSLTNLTAMAASGGTGTAFIADTNGNAGAQFVAAMNSIRKANQASCELAVPAAPAGQWIDFRQASVTYAVAGGASASLPWVASSANCSASGGFYYDDNLAPTKIELCPTTCSAVKADTQAALKVLFGCMAPSDGGVPVSDAGTGDAGRAACLLDGQWCHSSAECCSTVCNGSGYCGVVIN